jgi:mRNA interferase RelE/StbE
MKRTVVLSATALKQFLALDQRWQNAIEEKLDTLALNGPEALGNQLKRLQGSPYSRLRVGIYRLIFSDSGVVVAVVEIGNRDKVYKGL